MQITILGTGHMATTLAGGFLAAGHTVTFGSRQPAAHTDLAAPVLDTITSLEGADLVVNALQAAFSLDTLTPIASALGGRVLLDIGNAVTPAFELMYPTESLGEKLQAALPNTRVVKSLNTLTGSVAVDQTSIPTGSSVFLSGDDADAKALVAGLLDDLGWPSTQQIDLGGIGTARGPEHYFILFATLMQAFGNPNFNIKVIR
ncbi:MAG: NAD(P)-binding domain-containing protein [Microbacteriaceae bacterium]